MVVGDDDVNAIFLGKCDLIEINHAAVYGDKEFRPASKTLFDNSQAQAKALLMPVGNVKGDIFVIKTAEEIRKDYGTWNAVGVVIGEDGDVLTSPYGLNQPVPRFLHIRKKQRVVEFFVIGT